jgi:hypothetical protein
MKSQQEPLIHLGIIFQAFFFCAIHQWHGLAPMYAPSLVKGVLKNRGWQELDSWTYHVQSRGLFQH